MFFLLVNDKFIKVTQSVEQALYHADILAPNDDYYVNEVHMGSFKNFTGTELRRIHDSHIDHYKASPDWNREILVGSIMNILNGLRPDPATVEELHAKLGRAPIIAATPPSQRSAASDLGGRCNPTAASTPRAQRSTSAPSGNRPKEGTTSALVWGVADSLNKGSGTVCSNDLLAHPDLAGINGSTVRTQFSHWRRATWDNA